MYVYLLVCLFAVVKFRVYVLIGSTRAPLSVFCVRVWCVCPIKKRKWNYRTYISSTLTTLNLTTRQTKSNLGYAARASHPFLKTSHNPLFRKREKYLYYIYIDRKYQSFFMMHFHVGEANQQDFLNIYFLADIFSKNMSDGKKNIQWTLDGKYK